MHYFLYTVFFSVFAWLMLTVHGRRRVLAVTLAGVIVVTLVVTPHASAGARRDHPSDSSSAEGPQHADSTRSEQYSRHSQCE